MTGTSHFSLLKTLPLQQRLIASVSEYVSAPQIGTTKSTQAGIARVPFDDASKGFPRHKLHHLRKKCPPGLKAGELPAEFVKAKFTILAKIERHRTSATSAGV
jgi:hypothetical protein